MLDERAEAADADADVLAFVRRAEIARQLEQFQCILGVIVCMLWPARRLANFGLSSSSLVPICA